MVPGNTAQVVRKSESFKCVKCPRCGKRAKAPRIAHAQMLCCNRCRAQFPLRGDAGLTPLREGLVQKEGGTESMGWDIFLDHAGIPHENLYNVEMDSLIEAVKAGKDDARMSCG